MAKNNTIRRIARIAIPLLKKYGVVKAGIFGSYARGDMKKKSDVDLLIQFRGKQSLFDYIDLKLDLEDKLQRKVDLVEYGAIKPIIKERILKEEKRIL